MDENDTQVALTINKNLSLDVLGVRVGKCVEPCKIKKKVTTTILTGASQLVCGIRSGSTGVNGCCAKRTLPAFWLFARCMKYQQNFNSMRTNTVRDRIMRVGNDQFVSTW